MLPLQAAEPAEMELTECGPRCACFASCGLGFSAAAAGAVARAVSLRQIEGKGWAVVADVPLPAGMVITHYAGEQGRELSLAAATADACMSLFEATGASHLAPTTCSHPQPAVRRVPQE